MKAFVIFGSKSDSGIYKPLIKELKRLGVEAELKVASAHRNSEQVDEAAVGNDADVIIAGAGLSAALPGVVASKTIKPVIGIPCKGNYQGLDALLSIMQMPSGIPVLAVGVNKHDVAAENAAKMAKKYETVTIIGDKSNGSVKKALQILEEFDVLYKFSDKPDNADINIEFNYFDEPIEKKDELVIYCPLLLEKDDRAEAALNILKHSSHGLWVGLNNGKNAALAAVEILNINGGFGDKLNKFREELKRKY